MAIITISRGSYYKGKEIAERVAQSLGYECLSREVLLEASEHFNVPEVKLERALHDAPSILDRLRYGKQRYLAYIQCAMLEHAQKDNLVYHGLAGHFVLGSLRHAMSVRVLANMQDRVRLEMEREGISRREALKILQNDDSQRWEWGHTLFGKDPWDPRLFDLVLHIHRISVGDAVEIITDTAKLEHFATTAESGKQLDDMVLAAQAKVKLVNRFPDAVVSSDDGILMVEMEAPLVQENLIVDEVHRLVDGMEGVKEVRTHVIPN